MTIYSAFIPCRSGSERVKDKNTRPFAGIGGGLLEIKLSQLSQSPRFKEIIVSSNDPIVCERAAAYAAAHDDRIVVIERPDVLGQSSTAMSDFIDYIAHLREAGNIMWTHVTSPFVTTLDYENAMEVYEAQTASGYDSLMSANKIQKFLWDENGPANYDGGGGKWPRSQDITPLFEINHAIYLLPFALMREMKDRVGRKPYLHALPEYTAMDIDWEEQFDMLDLIGRSRPSILGL